MPLIQRPVRFIRFLSVCLAACSPATLLLEFPALGFAQDEPAPSTTIAGDLFQFPPTTPDQILEAAILTRDLARLDDSRRFVRTLLDLKLSDPELRALRQRIGAGPFLELSGDRKLLPEARDLLLAINAASRSETMSSTELQKLIDTLAPASEAATQAAIALIANGENSVPALLAVDPETPTGRVADQLLGRHARDMRHGLMTQLHVADSPGRVRILKLLAGTADPDIAIDLLRWQFDPESDAEIRAAAAAAIEQLSHGTMTAVDATNASDLLTHRGLALLTIAAGRFTQIREPAIVDELTSGDLRSKVLSDAVRCLTDAVALNAENRRAVSLLLVARSAGTNSSLSEAASVAAGQTISDLSIALTAALEIGEARAGIELLRALRSSDSSAIDSEASIVFKNALKEAVNCVDPRVRFLACRVADEITDTDISTVAINRMQNAIRKGSLKPEAVVIDSNDQSLRDLDVAIENAGYTAALSQTGQEGFDAAVNQMSCELILLDAESAGWPLATTLANLRSDVRTRNVPVVVIGPDRFAARVSRLSNIYPGVWFLAEPVGIETLVPKLDSLLLPPHLLSLEDRAIMKKDSAATP
jgi:hypothetical protein